MKSQGNITLSIKRVMLQLNTWRYPIYQIKIKICHKEFKIAVLRKPKEPQENIGKFNKIRKQHMNKMRSLTDGNHKKNQNEIV